MEFVFCGAVVAVSGDGSTIGIFSSPAGTEGPAGAVEFPLVELPFGVFPLGVFPFDGFPFDGFPFDEFPVEVFPFAEFPLEESAPAEPEAAEPLPFPVSGFDSLKYFL